jgi:hypothetical protein
VQVGDLVAKTPKQEKKALLGIILKVDNAAIKVYWNKAYGTFWTLKDKVRVVK